MIRSSDTASTVIDANGPLRQSDQAHTYSRGPEEDERMGEEIRGPVTLIRSSDTASTVIGANGPLRQSDQAHTYSRGPSRGCSIPLWSGSVPAVLGPTIP